MIPWFHDFMVPGFHGSMTKITGIFPMQCLSMQTPFISKGELFGKEWLRNPSWFNEVRFPDGQGGSWWGLGSAN